MKLMLPGHERQPNKFYNIGLCGVEDLSLNLDSNNFFQFHSRSLNNKKFILSRLFLFFGRAVPFCQLGILPSEPKHLVHDAGGAHHKWGGWGRVLVLAPLAIQGSVL
jgi:hypothetical protein